VKTCFELGGIEFNQDELKQLIFSNIAMKLPAGTVSNVLDHLGPLLQVAVLRSVNQSPKIRR
jgi:hypothetical protein